MQLYLYLVIVTYSVHRSVQHSVVNRQIGLEGLIHGIGDVIVNRPWRGQIGHRGPGNRRPYNNDYDDNSNANSNANSNTNTASQSSSNANGK